ncbi:phosphodiester glycosidase family protein [Polyangium aurulentum]|uniref:phosphodiester glycosidase family protein n=1 Tax=Polyangium aurulentum TaxID=2567896 RepID=UPI001F1B28B1|nr:phosphodiester glycosidase family protein [Polyangium aurulentum]
MAEAEQKKKGRWGRRAAIGLGASAVVVGGVWYGIHNIPGFGPALADGVRSVLGPGVVAWIEDTAYGVADQVNVWRHGDEAPTTFWEAPPPSAALPAAVVPAKAPDPSADPGATKTADSKTAASPAFPPPTFAAPYANVATPGDGVWIAMDEGSRPGEPPSMAKSIVHPDPKRGFAAVAVVAMDLTRVSLHLVAGTTEPFNEKIPTEARPGLVPKGEHADLVAVFNGGFKALHGHYGMMLEGTTFLPPRDIACTVGMYRDGAIKIRTWTAIAETAKDMVAYRQTPACLVEQGELNERLTEYNKNWGATVSGETVIRRSAIGIDATGRTLFYGIGEAVTAQSLARAMKAAGAQDAAQLDVNYAYPRFLLFDHPPGTERKAVSSLVPRIDYRSHDYVREPSPRDFFYVLKRHTES